MSIEHENSISPQMDKLSTFRVDKDELPVRFIETTSVAPGVNCHVYEFEGDNTKDLGVIEIFPGRKTPLQEVLSGDRTIEGHISGEGTLTIIKPRGDILIFSVDPSRVPFVKTVRVGERMQWEASKFSKDKLVAYEVCIPPYKDGRFRNIPE